MSQKDSDAFFCEVCSETGEDFLVYGYCTNCNEYLCRNCFDYHRKPKKTRHHVLLEKDAMPKPAERPVAPGPDECVELCNKHPVEIAVFYCNNHDEFFCNSCAATTHRTCEFLYIPDAAKGFVESQELEKTFASLCVIAKLCEENIDLAAKNSVKSENQLSAAKKNVESYMENVKKVFAAKAEKIFAKMEEINNENKLNMTTVSNTSKSTKANAEVLKENLQRLCDKKQFCQLYTETKKAAKTIGELDLTITDVGNENAIQEFKCQCDKRLHQFVTNSSLFICIDPNDKKRLFPIYQPVMVTHASKTNNDVPGEQAPEVPEPNFPPPMIPPRKGTNSDSLTDMQSYADDDNDPIYEFIEDRH